MSPFSSPRAPVGANASKRSALRSAGTALLLLLSACGDSAGPEDRIVAGVDLAELFAPPTPSEIAQIADEWSGRDVSVQGLDVVQTSAVIVGGTEDTVRIVSHTVDGVTHFGAILAPTGALAGSLPIVVIAHGGDNGIDVDDALLLLSFAFGGGQDNYVFVAPSFRSEPLVFQGTEYRSGGEPSPWDRDVDDALALLNAAIAITPAADADRIGVLGLSRGASVGLLMAIRDPRIDVVVEFFGPTDFFGPFVQEVVEEALLGMPRDLPGLAYLDSRFIQPLKNGELAIDDVRSELVRRSPVYYADRLPQLQVHHGTADAVVPVGEAERLIEVMSALGRGEPEFEAYLYSSGGHDPLTLQGSIGRTVDFLGRLLSVSTSALYARR